MSKTTNTYIYKHGLDDQKRLQLLNDVYYPYSKKLLLQHFIQSKKNIIDLACGQGQLSCWMAQQIKAHNGIVYAIDINQEQLNLAKQRALDLSLTNIKFILSPAEKLNEIATLLPEKPDLIYSRWILMHLKQKNISEIMKHAFDILAPNGITIHEEVTLQESYIEPIPKSYASWLNIFEKLSQSLLVDYNIGSNLKKLFSELGYHNIEDRQYSPVFSNKERYFFILDLLSSQKSLIENKIISPKKIELILSQLEKDILKDNCMTMVNHFVSGYKI